MFCLFEIHHRMCIVLQVHIEPAHGKGRGRRHDGLAGSRRSSIQGVLARRLSWRFKQARGRPFFRGWNVHGAGVMKRGVGPL